MPAIDTYLFFDGTCAQAMRAYERLLGGKLEAMMTYGESPEGCPPAVKDRIMHASLLVGDRRIMASDWTPHRPGESFPGMKGFSVSVTYDTAAEANRLLDALLDGGQEQMPRMKTFFAEVFGAVTDRYGTPWMVGGGYVKQS